MLLVVDMQLSLCLSQRFLGLYWLIHCRHTTKLACYFHTGSQVSFFSNVVIKLLMFPTVFVFTPFAILLGWVGSIVAGHTKRMLVILDFSFPPLTVMWCEFQELLPTLSFLVHMLLVTQLALSCGRNNINHGMQHY